VSIVVQKMRAAADDQVTRVKVSLVERRRHWWLAAARRPRPSSAPAVGDRSVTSTCCTFNEDSTGTSRVYAVSSAVKHSMRTARATSATAMLTANPTTSGQPHIHLFVYLSV